MSQAGSIPELCGMETKNHLPAPPWDMDTAAARLKLLENDFNALDAERISANFTEDAEARFGTEFLKGREAIKNYITADLAKRKSYKLSLDLWGALKGRMAVRMQLDWSDADAKAHKSYGVQVFQFDDSGLIEQNYSSINDQVL